MAISYFFFSLLLFLLNSQLSIQTHKCNTLVFNANDSPQWQNNGRQNDDQKYASSSSICKQRWNKYARSMWMNILLITKPKCLIKYA